jgi:hypothetical protein
VVLAGLLWRPGNDAASLPGASAVTRSSVTPTGDAAAADSEVIMMVRDKQWI